MIETVSALAIAALILGPMVLINYQNAVNLTRTRIQLSLQKQITATLGQAIRQLREASTISSMDSATIDFENYEGTRCRIYLSGTTVWIRLGDDGEMDPIALATDAKAFSLEYYQVVSGSRVATTDPAEVDEVQVGLILEAADGSKLQGEQLVTLRLAQR